MNMKFLIDRIEEICEILSTHCNSNKDELLAELEQLLLEVRKFRKNMTED